MYKCKLKSHEFQKMFLGVLAGIYYSQNDYPPEDDAANQKWLDPEAENATDTPYGQNYTSTYGGVANYGEYCLAWDDENNGGKTGSNTACDPNNSTRPDWCSKKWCYVRSTSSDGVGATYDTAPSCGTSVTDVVQSGSSGGSYHGLNIYYSYEMCETTTTTTTTAASGSAGQEAQETTDLKAKANADGAVASAMKSVKSALSR